MPSSPLFPLRSTLVALWFAAAPVLSAGTLTVRADTFAATPDILGYNLGHFYPGSNTADWWRYAGVNGARAFVSPREIEPRDDIPGTGDGVTDQASFLARRDALRADPLNHAYIDWPDFEDEYENNTLNTLKSDIAADMAPETRFRMSISEFNVHTNGTFQGMPDTLDTPSKYARFGAVSVQLIKNFEKELYCFKFGQTMDSGATYGVTKNGMHHMQNGDAPYHTGGATMAAEVWRLVCKGLAPGGSQLSYTRDADGSIDDLDLRTSHQPSTGNYHVFSANYNGSGVRLTVDTSAWNIPAGSRFLLEEVGPNRFGGGRTWNTVSADGTLFDGTDNVLFQPANTVWLFTIPGHPLEPEQVIDASDDATVVDGIHAATTHGSAATLLVRNDPATADHRSATFAKFPLPVVHPPDIQLAILSVRARTSTPDSVIQSHVYGIEDDSWSGDAITWNNAPNLRQGAAAGKLIADRVITGQGDDARLLGQLVVSSTSNATRFIDVTGFLFSTTLQANDWTAVHSTPGTGGIQSHTATLPDPEPPSGFYRIQVR